MPSAAQGQKKTSGYSTACLFCERTGVFYFTASLNALPALKAGALDAGISICSLVCGFKPVRAARSLSSNVPNPTSCTLSPFLTAPMISSIRASKTQKPNLFMRNSNIFSFLSFACSAYLARWGQPTLHIWCNLPCTLGATYLAHLVQPTLHAGGNLPCTFGATYLARWGQPTLHIWCNLPCTLGATYLAHLVQPTLHAGGNLPCTFGATYLARWGQPTLHIWCNLPCTLGATYLAHL